MALPIIPSRLSPPEPGDLEHERHLAEPAAPIEKTTQSAKMAVSLARHARPKKLAVQRM
jgi:hypothetical protein